MVPANLTYFAPQHKRHTVAAGTAVGTLSPATAAVRLTEKRSPVNKSVQQINSEEEASVLSRYPFHGNRALPSSSNSVRGQCARDVEAGRAAPVKQRWSLIDVNNNRVDVDGEGQASEADVMLQAVGDRSRAMAAKTVLRGGRVGVSGAGGSPMGGGGRAKRQLSSLRSHSSNNKIHYKSPPMKRYSNVYEYAYMSDPMLNAIYEDSDSQ